MARINNTARSAAVDAIVDLIDGGSGAGRIEIRTGSAPSAISDASTGDLLGTNTFSPTAFGNGSDGVATANSITSDSSADDSGEASYFRVYAGGAADTAAIIEGSCGESEADMVFDNSTIVAGGVIAISAFTVTMPAS